jgi:hypothetical protein
MQPLPCDRRFLGAPDKLSIVTQVGFLTLCLSLPDSVTGMLMYEGLCLFMFSTVILLVFLQSKERRGFGDLLFVWDER